MRTQLISAMSCLVIISGCETSNESKSDIDVNSLPERRAHINCLSQKTEEYARVQGSPIELGIIASASCNSTRYALYDAISKVKNRYYAQGYIGASEREDPKAIAANIIKLRGY